MQCNGSTCTAVLKDLSSYSDSACTNVASYNFQDARDCISYWINPTVGNSGESFRTIWHNGSNFNNGTFSVGCCAYLAQYCENPNCSIPSSGCKPSGCSVQAQGQYQRVVCPSMGGLSALTLSDWSFSGLTQPDSGGTYGVSVQSATELLKSACYDANPVQQIYLHSLTARFCPNLNINQYSYSGPLEDAFNRANWNNEAQALNTLSSKQVFITSECCVRPDQTNLSPSQLPVPSNEAQCHMMTCFESPICAELMKAECSSVSNDGVVWPNKAVKRGQHESNCDRWALWTAQRLSNDGAGGSIVTAPSSAGQISRSGSVPASMDQHWFSLLDYCSTVTDPMTCEGLDILSGALLLPRLQSVDSSQIFADVAAVGSSGLFTLSFSITNRGKPLSALSVFNPQPTNFQVDFGKTTLATGEQTVVTVVALNPNAETAGTTYVMSNTGGNQTVSCYNCNYDCSMLNTVTSPGAEYIPFPDQYPVAPSCFSGDSPGETWTSHTSISFLFEGKAKSSTFCSAEQVKYYFPCFGHCVWPGCQCTAEAFNCVGGYDGGCDVRYAYSGTLTSFRSCTSFAASETLFYFYDASYSNIFDQQRRDFPVLGGFSAGVVRNPADISLLSYSLFVLPLSSGVGLS